MLTLLILLKVCNSLGIPDLKVWVQFELIRAKSRETARLVEEFHHVVHLLRFAFVDFFILKALLSVCYNFQRGLSFIELHFVFFSASSIYSSSSYFTFPQFELGAWSTALVSHSVGVHSQWTWSIQNLNLLAASLRHKGFHRRTSFDDWYERQVTSISKCAFLHHLPCLCCCSRSGGLYLPRRLSALSSFNKILTDSHTEIHNVLAFFEISPWFPQARFSWSSPAGSVYSLQNRRLLSYGYPTDTPCVLDRPLLDEIVL